MTQIGGHRACGKRADFNFRTAIRPNAATGACPNGHKACVTSGILEMPNVQHIICIGEEEDLESACPITQLTFSSESQDIVELLNSLTFSKEATNLPLTNFKLAQTPCMDNFV